MITIRYVTPQPRPELRAPIAAFVKAALGGMAALLGPLHAESYVHVLAADGDAYG
jgi:4-oxalocrotonate tautomerase